MTGIDYRREWNLIQESEKSLHAHVQQRLKELIIKYPDVPLYSEIPAKELSERWIKRMSILELICAIDVIEKWSAERQPVIQTKINL
jgi:hypothetical protein